MNMMVNMMREHVPQETRIHYVITSGGIAPNVTPDFAEVYYVARHPDAQAVDDIWKRLEAAALGAALGTETKVDWEIITGMHGLLINKTLAKVGQKHMEALGGIDYTAEERAFAEAIYATFNNPRQTLASAAEVQPLNFRPATGGSTDVGDVSIAVPTVGFLMAAYVPGTAGHSWQAVASSGMSIGFKGATLAAKAMALTAIELYESPSIIEAANKEHGENLGDNFTYEAMLGDRPPPLNYLDK